MPERSKAPDPREETPDDRQDACPVRSKTCDSAVCMAGNLRAGRTVQHDRSSDRYRVSGDGADDVGNGGYGMKKRLEKKVEKMRRKKVHEILEMVLEINTTYERRQEVTGNKPTAFFWFNGHTASLDISVYQNGWYPDCREYQNFNTIFEYSMDELLEELSNRKKELQDAGKM